MADRRTFWGALLRLIISAGMALCLVALAASDVAAWRHDRRGVEDGADPELAPISQPRYGTNVALEQYTTDAALDRALAQATRLGFGVLRQRLPWAEIEPAPGAWDWSRWDRIVDAVQAADLRLILVLETSPAWARRPWDADNPHAPPSDVADYAAFVQAVAERYCGKVLAYQVWDNPNVAPYWGAGEIDPGGYVAMLRVASAAIRAADPGALVLAGGMAPTVETRGRNMSDIVFVRELCRLGATPLYDALAVKPYGFWSGPLDRRVSEGVLNFSRVVLVREELRRLGAEDKAIWAVEGGWAALPDDWAGEPSAVGSDSAAVQAERFVYAVTRVRKEWPWLGLLCMGHLQPAAEPTDPVWGLAWLNASGVPTELALRFDALASLSTDVLYPGRYAAQAVMAAQAAKTSADVTFYGTALAVASESTQHDELTVIDTVEGMPRQVHIAPHGRLTWLARAPLATTVGVRMSGTTESLSGLRTFVVRYARRWHSGVKSVFAALAGLGLLAVGMVSDARLVPWRHLWGNMQRFLRAAPCWPKPLALAACATLALFGPSSATRAIGLIGYAALALLDANLALRAALVALFLAPLYVHIGRWQFSCAELAILLAVVAHVWDLLVAGALRAAVRGWWQRRSLADLAVALYVALGLFAAVRAVYQHEALREWRLVFAEPALLYALLRSRVRDASTAAQAARMLLYVGVGLAMYALVAYTSPAGVIEAEGARRARAYFGSPNNLALLLERVLPLGLALGLAMRRQRWLWLGVAGLILAAIGLTFSRGAWVLGVPAGLLTVLGLHSRRSRRVALLLIVCGVLLIVPLSRMPRFADLANLASGTSFLRVQLWRSAWQMGSDHWLWGVGPDNFLYYYGDYILPGAEVDRWLSHPHNIVLDFWLRLGLPGAVLLALVAGVAIRSARLALRQAGPHRVIAIGLAGGLAAMLAHGLVDSSLFVVELAGWFLAALALLQVLAGEDLTASPS